MIGSDPPVWRILTVCTANMCRSPMAEALLRHHLEKRGRDAVVSSAGLLEDGHPAAPEVVALLSARGIDLSGHRSRRLVAPLIEGSDLVLAMAREHLREAVLLVPSAFGRIFTLKEIVRRGEAVGPVGPVGSDGPDGPDGPDGLRTEWLDRLAQGRRRRELMGNSPQDDVADPSGGPMSAFRSTLDELDDLTGRLAALLAPSG
ncbi:MAG: arsenate reductase/protein-tyrosine-phosphatase family protein [Acidimicrobiales bacterium]